MKNRKISLWLLGLAAVILGAGCFNAVGTSLEVVSVSPDVAATDVLIDSSVTIETTADLDALTVTADSVRLLKGTSTGTPVAVEVTVTAGSITIDPAALLDFGTAYTVVIAGTVADADGNMLSGEVSWGFTTRPLIVSVSTTGGQPAAAARISIGGSFVGTTDAAGEAALTWPSGGTAAIAAEKKFFIPTADPGIPLDGSTYDAQLEVAPYIYVPDRWGSVAAVPKITRMEAVDSDPASYTAITAVEYGSGPSTYTLTGPRWVEVDYDNGVIYVIDAPADASPSFLIKMTDFPPAADGSDAEAVSLTDVSGAQQLHINDDGSVVVIDFRFFGSDPNYQEGRLVQVPADLNYGLATIGPWNAVHMYGLTQLASGQYLSIGGDWGDVDAILFDDVSDLVTETFSAITYGSGIDQMQLPSRVMAPGDGSFVYISDTGSPSYQNDRLVRYSSAGTGFAEYGANGGGIGQFVHPVLLGLLPDNKLYIMDVGNSRLVRIDPGIFDAGAADWVESDPGANFDFDYWYNYS